MARDNVHEMKRTAQRERVDAVRHPKAALRVAVAGLGAMNDGPELLRDNNC